MINDKNEMDWLILFRDKHRTEESPAQKEFLKTELSLFNCMKMPEKVDKSRNQKLVLYSILLYHI